MAKHDEIAELHKEIQLLNNKIEFKNVLKPIKLESDKDFNTDFITLKNTIRMYMETTSDYTSPTFTKLCEIQANLDNYYNRLIRQYFKKDGHTSQEEIEIMLKNLKKHSDIYSEIIEYILAKGKYKKELIKVEGYDVRLLYNRYNISLAGAYNYLIYLREAPEVTLYCLRFGLPTK